MDWSPYYPAYVSESNPMEANSVSVTSSKKLTRRVTVADIGCGFGGLLFALSPKLPDSIILGEPLHDI